MTIACSSTTKVRPTMWRFGSRCRRAKSMLAPCPAVALALDELLAADDADLGEAQALRGRHHRRGVLVLGRLVRAQVQFGLRLLRGGRLEALLERRPVGNHLAVPEDAILRV